MQLTHLLAGFLLQVVSAKEGHSRRAVTCAFSTTPDSGATCSSFASSWGLTVATLQSLNPGISCPNLDTSTSYCVIGTVTADPTTSSSSTTLKTSTTSKISTTTSTTSTTTSTTSTTTIKTSTTTSTTSTSTSTTSTSTITTSTTISAPIYSPTMPGIVDGCDGFYMVSSGDQCDTIAAKYGITVTQLKTWNTQINDGCTNLWLGYYVCVHVPGTTTASTTSTTSIASATSTTSATPTETTGPTPQMPGIISGCKTYYLVKSGDSCYSIYTAAGITLAQFLLWNTAIDSSCSNLWLGYYVCTGV